MWWNVTQNVSRWYGGNSLELPVSPPGSFHRPLLYCLSCVKLLCTPLPTDSSESHLITVGTSLNQCFLILYKQPLDNLTSVKIPHNNTLPVTHCHCVVFLSSTSRLVASLRTRHLFPPYLCFFNHSSPKLSLYYRADLTDFVFFPNYPFQGFCDDLTETSISLQY